MTFSKDVIQDLQNEVKIKKKQRKSTLELLKTLDAYIDKLDGLIKKIDKGIPGLLEEINDAIDDVEKAYNNRIAIGCSSGLAWTLVEDGFYIGDLQIMNFNFWEVTSDNETEVKEPLYGLRYYRKPSNRDYGTTIIKEFKGSIELGSNELAVLSIGGTSKIEIGDTITDDLIAPSAFEINKLPTVISFGTTTNRVYSNTIVGNVSSGSTIFNHVGIGSTTGIAIGNIFYNPSYVLPETTVVGFGTTATSYQVLDYDVGVPFQTSITVVTNTIILSNAAIQTGNDIEFNIGIVTTVPSLLLSTTSSINITNDDFGALRLNDNFDEDLDYTKSPINPITVGIINSSTLGIGHSIELADNGASSKTKQWDIGEDEDPPEVGAGKVTYSKGSLSWPTIITCTGTEPYYVCTEEYAELGTVAIANTTASIGTTSVSPIPGRTPTSPICVSYASSIAAAEERLSQIRSTNLGKVNKLIATSKTLRKLRDDKELNAWSLLQGASYLRAEYKDLEDEIDSLLNTDFSSFES